MFGIFCRESEVEAGGDRSGGRAEEIWTGLHRRDGLPAGLRTAFEIKISSREMLDCETIAALTAHIVGKMPASEAQVAAAADAERVETAPQTPVEAVRRPLSEGQRGLWAHAPTGARR